MSLPATERLAAGLIAAAHVGREFLAQHAARSGETIETRIGLRLFDAFLNAADPDAANRPVGA